MENLNQMVFAVLITIPIFIILIGVCILKINTLEKVLKAQVEFNKSQHSLNKQVQESFSLLEQYIEALTKLR